MVMAKLFKEVLSLLVLDFLIRTTDAFSEPSIHVGEIYLGKTAEWECRYDSGDVGDITHVSIYREECHKIVSDGPNKGKRVVKWQAAEGSGNELFVLEGAWENRTVTHDITDPAFYVTLSDIIYEDEQNMCCCVSDQSNGSGRKCSKNLKQDVYDKPGKADIKVITPSTGKVDIQDEIELRCELDSDKEGNPEHSKYAFTNGSWISDTQDLNRITVSGVSVDPVYSCYAVTESYAESSEGTYLNGESSDPASYEVYYPADVIYPTKESPRELTPLYTDADFSVICEAVGYPEPNVWLGYCEIGFCVEKAGFTETQRNIEVDYEYDVTGGIQVNFTWGITDTEVTCENVNYYDGEFVKCIARNSDTEGSPNEDQADRYLIKTRYPPLWKGEDVFAEFGEKDVQLKCNVCAYKEDYNDNMEFKWFRNGTDTSYTGESYTISEVTENEFNTFYECEATNSVGTEKYGVPLIESGPPRWSSEVLTILSNVSSIAATLSWIIGPDGNNPPISYSIWVINKETDLVYKHENIKQKGNVAMLILGASNAREDGNNEADKNLTANAITEERPEVEIGIVTFTRTEMTVTWFYSTDLLGNEIEVGVRVRYWIEGSNPITQSETYPENYIIPASEEFAKVPDDYQDAVYNIELLVYENSLLSESSADIFVTQESGIDESNGSNVGLIAGLFALLLAVVIVLLVLVLIMYLKIMPARLARNDNEQQVSTRSEAESNGVPNPAIECEEITGSAFPENAYEKLTANWKTPTYYENVPQPSLETKENEREPNIPQNEYNEYAECHPYRNSEI